MGGLAVSAVLQDGYTIFILLDDADGHRSHNNHILRRGALDDLWSTCWLATSALMMVLTVYEER